MKTATVVEVRSDSHPDTLYRVWVGDEGPIFCDCPGHKYARKGRRVICKHMKALGADAGVLQAAKTVAKTGNVQQPKDGRFRFLHVEEEVNGAWVAVTDAARFAGLELA